MENVEYEIGYYHDYASVVTGVLVTRSCAHIRKEESVLCQSRVSEQKFFSHSILLICMVLKYTLAII